jgi:hypothetical protein
MVHPRTFVPELERDKKVRFRTDSHPAIHPAHKAET